MPEETPAPSRKWACSVRRRGAQVPGRVTSPLLLTVGQDSHLNTGHNSGEQGVAGAESEWCCCLSGPCFAKQVLREPAPWSPIAQTGGKVQVQSKV